MFSKSLKMINYRSKHVGVMTNFVLYIYINKASVNP